MSDEVTSCWDCPLNGGIPKKEVICDFTDGGRCPYGILSVDDSMEGGE